MRRTSTQINPFIMTSSISTLLLIFVLFAVSFALSNPENFNDHPRNLLQWRDNEGIRVKRGWGYGGGYPGGFGGGYPGGYGGYGGYGGFPQYGGGSYGSSSWGSYSSSRSGGYSSFNSGFYGRK